MSHQKITTLTIKKLGGVIINSDKKSNPNTQAALTLNMEMMSLGFMMSEALLNATAMLSFREMTIWSNVLISTLRNLKGDDVQYSPMYANFPKQVIDSEDVELYFNALCHYWSSGQWLPSYSILKREFAFEHVKYQQIDLCSEEQFFSIFTTLLSSKESLSEEDKDIVKWFIIQYPLEKLDYPGDIPFAENRCVAAAVHLKQKQSFSHLVKTATDILRIVTYLSGGDVSLATNSRFISLPRATRKQLVNTLESVINEEDIGRHRNKWVKLFHSLHVGAGQSHQNLLNSKHFF